MAMEIPTAAISKTGGNLADIANRMQQLSGKANSINNAISSCYMQGGVGGRAGAAATRMSSIASRTDGRGGALCTAARLYERTEDTLTGKGRTAASTIKAGYNVSWASKPAIQSILNVGIGAAKVTAANTLKSLWNGTVKQAQLVGDFWSEAYRTATGKESDKENRWFEKKGTLYKVFQTGKAIATIGTSVAGCVAVWGATVASGGAGAPLAVLGTVYTGNTVANSIADIYNCWAGDIEQVGEVNLLKDGLVKGGGDIGELLGDKDAGETIGEIVYTTGSLLSTVSKVEALAGKVIQSGDLWSDVKGAVSETGKGIKGVWDVASNSNLSTIKYDLKLLSYEVPHIENVGATVDLLKDVGEKTVKIVNGTCETVESIVDYIINR